MGVVVAAGVGVELVADGVGVDGVTVGAGVDVVPAGVVAVDEGGEATADAADPGGVRIDAEDGGGGTAVAADSGGGDSVPDARSVATDPMDPEVPVCRLRSAEDVLQCVYCWWRARTSCEGQHHGNASRRSTV